MRPLTAGEEAVLLADDFGVGVKIEVEASSSTSVFNALTNYCSKNWLESVRISNSVDQLVARCDLNLAREQSSSQSISPLSSGSTCNQSNTSTYGPTVDVGRELKVSVATVPTSCAVGSTDYNVIFRGTIDEWDAREDPMRVRARDLGGYLMDRWIEAEKAYPLSTNSTSMALEGVMQDILDDALGSTDIALNTTASSSGTLGFNVSSSGYRQERMPILSALQRLADLIGFRVRYEWSTASSDYTLQLLDVDHASTSTAAASTFGPSRYEKVPRLQLSRENIRNVVEVAYPTTSNTYATVTASDTSSIDRYGRRWMRIQLPGDSPITSSSEANTMATAALNDLALPDVEQNVEMHVYWPVELNDLYVWQNNDRHYDTDQVLAVVDYVHDLSRNRHRTMIGCRGKPRSGTRRWISDSTQVVPSPEIVVMGYRSGSTGNAIIDVTANPETNAVFVTISSSEPAAPTTSANNGTFSGYVGTVTSTVNVGYGDDVHFKAVGQSLDGTLGRVAYKIETRPYLGAAITIGTSSAADLMVYLASATSAYSTGATYVLAWTANGAVTTGHSLSINHYRYSTSSTDTSEFMGVDTVTDATTGINAFNDADGSTVDSEFYVTTTLLSSGGTVLQTLRSEDQPGVDYS